MVPIGIPTVCWKNTSSKRNKYVVNQEIKHLDNVSFREFFVWVILYKVGFIPPQDKILVSTFAILFTETKSYQLFQFVF